MLRTAHHRLVNRLTTLLCVIENTLRIVNLLHNDGVYHFRQTKGLSTTIQLGAAPGIEAKDLIPGNDSDRPTSESQ